MGKEKRKKLNMKGNRTLKIEDCNPRIFDRLRSNLICASYPRK
jgi:hypothetical protein